MQGPASAIEITDFSRSTQDIEACLACATTTRAAHPGLGDADGERRCYGRINGVTTLGFGRDASNCGQAVLRGKMPAVEVVTVFLTT